MATVIGATAARAYEVENISVVSGEINDANGHLILKKGDGSTIDAGLARDDDAISSVQNNIMAVAVDLAGVKSQMAAVKPFVHAYLTGTVNIPNNTDTFAPLSTEVEDTDGMHSTVTNTDRFTCVTPGLYLFVGQVGFSAQPLGFRQLDFYLGASTLIGRFNTDAMSGIVSFVSGSVLVRLTAGDYVRMSARHNVGSTLTFSANNTFMQAIWLSP